MIGSVASAFTAKTPDGQAVSLESLRGRWVVLFFYPKDNSPGCSIEAAKFEHRLGEFEALNASVVGVSTDSEASHSAFREKCELSYALVSDTDKSISKAYGVLGGLTGLFGVADRQSFLIDPQGRVAHHWRRVNPLTHALDVLKELERQDKAVSA